MRKLSDSELATRTRDANRRRSERARERLTIAGHAALTVWLPVGLRQEFVTEASGSGMTISELATRLIEKGLREKSLLNNEFIPDPETSINFIEVIPDPDTADLFATPEPEPQTPVVVADTASTPPPVSVSFDRDAMMAMVDRLHSDGLRGADIARQLTAAGYRSSNGAELRGANVLREYRVWKEKADGSAKTAV